MSALVAHEALVRGAVFAAVFVAMVGWEHLSPRRELRQGRAGRWVANLSLVALDTVLVRLLVPAAAVGAAAWASDQGTGILHMADLPLPLAFVAAMVALDGVIWAQHLLFHHVPWLWRLHEVHHADLDYDVTTALRFHPVEILLSMVIKVAAVIVIGAPVAAVVAFEVVLNGMAMFNHGNVRLPAALDAALRWVVVTPDMHRVHHSVVVAEANSNFGFNLSVWDRLFRTYRAQPRGGHTQMTIGTPDGRAPTGRQTLVSLLLRPFVTPRLTPA